MALLDKTRKDIRKTVQETPVWVTSQICGIECDSKATVLFEFPKTVYGTHVFIHEILARVGTAFTDAGADILVGLGTIADGFQNYDNDDTVVAVDADEYFATAEITLTAGAVTYGKGDYLAIKAAGTPTLGTNLIACADTTMPVIYMTMDATAAMAGTGDIQFCMLISPVPFGR